MSPTRSTTRAGDMAEARARRRVAQKYLEVADLISSEDGLAIQLVGFKPGSHYGDHLLQSRDRDSALRAAQTLVDRAIERTT